MPTGTTRLPSDIWAIIEGYWYSHHVFCLKQSLHRELRHTHCVQELRVFYELFYSPLNPYPHTAYPHTYPGPYAVNNPLPAL